MVKTPYFDYQDYKALHANDKTLEENVKENIGLCQLTVARRNDEVLMTQYVGTSYENLTL